MQSKYENKLTIRRIISDCLFSRVGVRLFIDLQWPNPCFLRVLEMLGRKSFRTSSFAEIIFLKGFSEKMHPSYRKIGMTASRFFRIFDREENSRPLKQCCPSSYDFAYFAHQVLEAILKGSRTFDRWTFGRRYI